jgi:hypothetical protein
MTTTAQHSSGAPPAVAEQWRCDDAHEEADGSKNGDDQHGVRRRCFDRANNVFRLLRESLQRLWIIGKIPIDGDFTLSPTVGGGCAAPASARSRLCGLDVGFDTISGCRP